MQLNLRQLLTQVAKALLSPYAAPDDLSALQDTTSLLLRESCAVGSFDASNTAELQLLSWLFNAEVRCHFVLSHKG